MENDHLKWIFHDFPESRHLGVCQNLLLSMLVGCTPIKSIYFDVHQGYKVLMQRHIESLRIHPEKQLTR